jgi:hypothetical protein
MMKLSFRSDLIKICVTLFVILFAVSSCTNNQREDEHKILPDSARTDTIAKTEQKTEPVMVNRIYNDISRFLAAMPQDSGSTLKDLEMKPEFISYRKSFESGWMKLDSGRLARMRKFAETEFPDVNANAKTIFYPFSGPDVLNVYTFFPGGKDYYMLGLEPAGSLPPVHPGLGGDSLNLLFNSLNKSLHAILNYSFFRTLSMAEDLRSEQLHGTLPIMMLFLARTGNTVLNVEEVTINNAGDVVLKGEAANDSTASHIKGTRIYFKNGKTGDASTVTYFSADIVDQSLKGIPGFLRFTDKLDHTVTYLKSASYLMHKTYFSGIRTTILNKSNYILQDDSGIPLRFLKDSTTWDLTFYGNYIRPIPLFANWYQPDLLEAYSAKDHNKVKPLDFGIGYNFKSGSNLLLAKKKSI